MIQEIISFLWLDKSTEKKQQIHRRAQQDKI